MFVCDVYTCMCVCVYLCTWYVFAYVMYVYDVHLAYGCCVCDVITFCVVYMCGV